MSWHRTLDGPSGFCQLIVSPSAHAALAAITLRGAPFIPLAVGIAVLAFGTVWLLLDDSNPAAAVLVGSGLAIVDPLVRRTERHLDLLALASA